MSFSLTLRNETSIEWYLQIAHPVSLVHSQNPTQQSAAAVSPASRRKQTAADKAVVQQLVFLQSAYAIPNEAEDTLTVISPAQYSLAIANANQAGNQFEKRSGAEAHVAAEQRSFAVDGSGLNPQSRAGFVSPSQVGLINRRPASATVLVQQQGSPIGAVTLPANQQHVQHVVQLSSEYWYRIVTMPLSCLQAVSNDWEKHDWRRVPIHSSATESRSTVLRVTVRMQEGELVFAEERHPAAVDTASSSSPPPVSAESPDAPRSPSTAPVAPFSPVGASSSSPPARGSKHLLLTGDLGQAGTQLVLLTLFEKELFDFKFRGVDTSALPVNHPLRAVPAPPLAGGNGPLGATILPFLHEGVHPSLGLEATEHDLRDAATIATWVDTQFATGTRLTSPQTAAQKERMEAILGRIAREFEPPAAALLDELHYGPLQGHRSNPSRVKQLLTTIKSALDWLNGELQGKRWIVGESFTLADLALLPTLNLLEQASPDVSGWIQQREQLRRHMVELKQRPSWKVHLQTRLTAAGAR
jgi:glutathione S-transferase